MAGQELKFPNYGILRRFLTERKAQIQQQSQSSTYDVGTLELPNLSPILQKIDYDATVFEMANREHGTGTQESMQKIQDHLVELVTALVKTQTSIGHIICIRYLDLGLAMLENVKSLYEGDYASIGKIFAAVKDFKISSATEYITSLIETELKIIGDAQSELHEGKEKTMIKVFVHCLSKLKKSSSISRAESILKLSKKIASAVDDLVCAVDEEDESELTEAKNELKLQSVELLEYLQVYPKFRDLADSQFTKLFN